MYQELKLNKQTVGQIIFNSFKPESGKQDLLEWIEFQWSKFQLMKLKTDRLIFFICLSLFLFLLAFFAKEAKADSVKFVFSEENKPERIFLFPGRVSLLKLPCSITKALIGSPNDIKTEVDKLNPEETHILLKKWRSQPSNLILKCKDKVFLFSLIPSKKSHYDYVKVLGHVSSKPLKVKSASPNSPSPLKGDLREQDWTIRKILDFSWSDKK